LAGRFEIAGWVFDPARGTLSRDDTERELPETHSRVLLALVERAGRPIETRNLLERGWQSGQVSEDNLSVAVSHLRAALDDGSDQPEVIRSVPGGYELLATVEKERSEFLGPGKLPRVLLTMLVVVVILLSLWRARSPNPPVAVGIEPFESIAVLPFESTDPDLPARALSSWLTDEIRTWSDLKTIAERSASLVAPDEAAELLGVDTILRGRLERHARGYEVSMTLTNAAGEPLWRQSLTRDRAAFHELLSELVGNLESVLALEIEDQREIAPDGPTVLAYFEAREALAALDPATAIALTRDLIETRPTFLPPYFVHVRARLAMMEGNPIAIRQALPQLIEVLDRALVHDARNARAHLLQGTLLFLYAWDFEKAGIRFQRAGSLAPNDPEVHFQLARYTACVSDFDKTTVHLNRMKELDPLGYPKLFTARIYNMTRRYEYALEELGLVAPGAFPSWELDGAYARTYEYMGDFEKAFFHFEKVFGARGFTETEVATARARFQAEGLKGVYTWLINDGFKEQDIGQYEPPLAIARYCAGADNTEYAFYWLEQAFESRQTELLYLEVDPKYDTLRSDPRFKALRDRMFTP